MPAPKPSRPPEFRRPIRSDSQEKDRRPRKPDDGQQDHHLGGFLRRHLQQQHEQRRRPQRDAVDAGLRAGIAEPRHQQAARILEQVEPVGLDRLRPLRPRWASAACRATCSAQASDLRASSKRPWRASQRGDSGTQRRTSRTTSAGSTPIANSSRHWSAGHEGTQHGAEADAERNDAGDESADPAALGGRHELLHQRQVDAIEAADADADEEAHDREIDPAIVRREVEQAGGDREIQHRADEDLASADAVGEPAPDIGADDRADAGAHQHDGRLAEGELPRPDQEGQHEADQEVVEEFERIADDRRGDDLLLVAGQTWSADRGRRTWHFPWRFFCWGGRAPSFRPMRTLRSSPCGVPAFAGGVCPSKRSTALQRAFGSFSPNRGD